MQTHDIKENRLIERAAVVLMASMFVIAAMLNFGRSYFLYRMMPEILVYILPQVVWQLWQVAIAVGLVKYLNAARIWAMIYSVVSLTACFINAYFWYGIYGWDHVRTIPFDYFAFIPIAYLILLNLRPVKALFLKGKL